MLGDSVEGPVGDPGDDGSGTCGLGVESVDGVDVEPHDRVRILLGNRLDVDATLRRQHEKVLLRRPVEREAGVVLVGDVRRVLDPDPLDDVALDVHAEDVRGVGPHLVGVVGELDPARLAAAADLHLGLDDHRVAGRLSRGDRLVDGVGHATWADRDVVAGEVLLALVLEQIHAILSPFPTLSSRARPRATC